MDVRTRIRKHRTKKTRNDKLKRIFALLLTLTLALTTLTACGQEETTTHSGMVVACTTYPVYLMTQAVTQDVPDVTVKLVVNQQLSCLHNYTLTMADMKTIESADLLVINGAGLESFLDDVLASCDYWDASRDMPLRHAEEGHDHGDHDHDADHEEYDPHYWLSPALAGQMAQNIAIGLTTKDPAHMDAYQANADQVAERLTTLQAELRAEVADLPCKELIPFHDGFAYFADAFGLTILASVEEEEGSEASAREINELTQLIQAHHIPAVFVEKNGSDSAAQALARECGVSVAALDMGMSGDEQGGGLAAYEALLRRNIDTIREAYT